MRVSSLWVRVPPVLPNIIRIVMQPITNTPQFSADGTRRSVMTLDPFAMVLNSFAMGDVIAAAPVVKYMIDNFYTTPDSYRVVAKQAFRPFFPFVPDSNFHDYDERLHEIGTFLITFRLVQLTRKMIVDW